MTLEFNAGKTETERGSGLDRIVTRLSGGRLGVEVVTTHPKDNIVSTLSGKEGTSLAEIVMKTGKVAAVQDFDKINKPIVKRKLIKTSRS